MPAITDESVARIFAAWPDDVRARLLALRQLIFDTAVTTAGVGPLLETLKWGEPAYLTETTGSGTTLRLGWKSHTPAQYALYVNCKTSLVDSFRSQFPDLRYDGARAILFDVAKPLPSVPVSLCIAMALTYHLRKARS